MPSTLILKRPKKTLLRHANLNGPHSSYHLCRVRSSMDKQAVVPLSNRKIRKPLMEKRRRARINKSLNELQQLLSDADSGCKSAKMEKADILEMTVQYLKQIKLNNVEPTRCKKENENNASERYHLGYMQCVEETRNMIDMLPDVSNQIREKINSHMKMCLENLRNHSAQYINEAKVMRKIDIRNSSQLYTETCDSLTHSTILLQGPDDYCVLPSKLLNGDVILIISPKTSKNHHDMWRPWW